MSTAAVADATDATPKKKRLSKKLVVMLAGALLLLALAGGGAFAWLKFRAAQQAAEAAEEAEDGEAEIAAPEARPSKPKTPPVFVALEQFTVNLADKESERFVQVAVSLEIADAKVGDQIKLYMPAIRNGVLMILAHKTSPELLTRAGKEQLAREIQAEVALAMGLAPVRGAPVDPEDDESPVRHVHFSHFIIQ